MEHTTQVECPDGRVRTFHTSAVVWDGTYIESKAQGYVYAEGHRVYGVAARVRIPGEIDVRTSFTPGGKYRELVLSPVAPSDGIETLDMAEAREDAVAAMT